MAHKHRILVADDDAMVRMVMRSVLAYQGYLIEEAVDGEDAVQKYKNAEQAIDLVMMDVNMPEMGGQDALSHLKKVNPAIKAILLSGGIPQSQHQPNGSIRFLQKPFINDELIQMVGEMLPESPATGQPKTATPQEVTT